MADACQHLTATRFTSFPPRTSTRFITEPLSARPPGTPDFTTAVKYQTPSGTRGKEKLPVVSQVVRRERGSMALIPQHPREESGTVDHEWVGLH